jgi:selenocysteine-specific elongation factor
LGRAACARRDGRDDMAKLIGTAGHVDHGKTALILALTGIDADRLPEEKRRGMTIDVGFAHIELPGHGQVSIVDVPGHERFLTNMLVGALGVDVALLCVAADESVMPQTREHFAILDLLPVEEMVVALTRADLADAELRALARAEVEELLEGTRFGGSPVVPVSAFTGEGLEALREALSAALGRRPEGEETGPWYLPVDRAFVAKGHGVVATGTLAGGRVREGDAGVLLPGGLETRVRAIHRHDQRRLESEPGARTALNLGGLKLEQVRRGQVVCAPGAAFETRCVDARIRWEATAKHGMRARVSLGADEAIAKLFLSDHDGELAQLRFERPVAAAARQPLIVRRYSPPELLGGGRIEIPQARPRRRSEAPVAPVASLDEAEAIVEVVGRAAEGAPTEEVCVALGRTNQALGETFERLRTEGRLLGFAGLWFTPETFAACAARLLGALQALHEAEPARAMHPRDMAVQRAGLGWSGKPLDRAIGFLASEGRLRASGTEIASAEFRVRLNPRQRELLDRAIAVLDAAGANVPGAAELAQALGTPPQAAEEIVRVGLQAGELVIVADGIVYSLAGLEALREIARRLGSEGPFLAAAFRDAAGTSRRYAIPLLEHFDRTGLTARMGDLRYLRWEG